MTKGDALFLLLLLLVFTAFPVATLWLVWRILQEAPVR